MNFKEYFQIIKENFQLAEKLFFKTGKIDNEGKNKILQISHGDYLTKFMCEAYSVLNDSELKNLYKLAKQYNKMVFPIIGYEDWNKWDSSLILGVYQTLQNYDYIVDSVKTWPSIAKRNFRKEIRKERTSSEIYQLQNIIGYITSQLGLLSNRDTRTVNVVMRKIFSSNVETFEELSNILEEKSELIGGKKITKRKVKHLLPEIDADIIYESEKVWVLQVGNKEAIQKLGCNSLWCFTYGSNHHEDIFYQYSHNDMIYLIIDWSEEQEKYLSEYFMVVVIAPIREYSEEDNNDGTYGNIAYSLFNEPIDIIWHLKQLDLDPKIFTFDWK